MAGKCIVPIGGRIKAAALSFMHLIPEDILGIDDFLKNIYNNPFPELLQCFFPSDKSRIKHLLSNIGFFRPFIKTDQGMGGNFFPFYVNQDIAETILLPTSIKEESGIAIPEYYASHLNNDTISSIQKSFSNFSLSEVLGKLNIETSLLRRAIKGRTGFFFIRPGLTERPVIFGADILEQLNNKLNELLLKIFEVAQDEQAKFAPGLPFKDNILYGQVDAYILQNREIVIEKVHLPDVGLFLNSVSDPFGDILKNIQMISSALQDTLCSTLGSFLNNDVYLVTRDEVLENQEDILEIKEIENLCSGLFANALIKTHVVPLSAIESIPNGKQVILLNLDYQAIAIQKLLQRFKNQEIECYPNPFVQKASNVITGLAETTIPQKYQQTFLSLVRSLPKNAQARIDVQKRLDFWLHKYGIDSDIVHVDIGSELLPILTKSLYSWRQLPRRLDRYNNPAQEIKIRSIPSQGLLLKDACGSRLHVYRFMFTAKTSECLNKKLNPNILLIRTEDNLTHNF